MTLPPVLRLLNALRAGKPMDVAATEAGLSSAVARCVAGSPLAKALLSR